MSEITDKKMIRMLGIIYIPLLIPSLISLLSNLYLYNTMRTTDISGLNLQASYSKFMLSMSSISFITLLAAIYFLSDGKLAVKLLKATMSKWPSSYQNDTFAYLIRLCGIWYLVKSINQLPKLLMLGHIDKTTEEIINIPIINYCITTSVFSMITNTIVLLMTTWYLLYHGKLLLKFVHKTKSLLPKLEIPNENQS